MWCVLAHFTKELLITKTENKNKNKHSEKIVNYVPFIKYFKNKKNYQLNKLNKKQLQNLENENNISITVFQLKDNIENLNYDEIKKPHQQELN